MFRTTYPNKVFDYMAAGRPVILAIDGVIREVIETSGAGIFVPPSDDRALSEAVLHLRNHPEKARDMGVAGKAYLEKQFNRVIQAERFYELVRNLVRPTY